ncbi:MAG: hypothetical protein MN733_15515 [Nitrososphaera sp.]|nr:hypothetical protein [Nitrososphaera sp.]
MIKIDLRVGRKTSSIQLVTVTCFILVCFFCYDGYACTPGPTVSSDVSYLIKGETSKTITITGLGWYPPFSSYYYWYFYWVRYLPIGVVPGSGADYIDIYQYTDSVYYTYWNLPQPNHTVTVSVPSDAAQLEVIVNLFFGYAPFEPVGNMFPCDPGVIPVRYTTFYMPPEKLLIHKYGATDGYPNPTLQKEDGKIDIYVIAMEGGYPQLRRDGGCPEFR